jgi:hypothetical protein
VFRRGGIDRALRNPGLCVLRPEGLEVVRAPRRFYAAHRRAYTPRLWPMLLGTTLLVAAIAVATNPTVLEAIAIGAGVALVVGVGRWELWKRRHPVITPAQYITDLRRNAHWN